MKEALKKVLFGGLVALTGILIYRYQTITHNSRFEQAAREISDLCKDQKVLGNYPNFLGDKITIVYSKDVGGYISDFKKSLSQYDIDVHNIYYEDLTATIKGNFISVGSPCLNGKTREMLVLSADSCYNILPNDQARIELHNYPTNALLVYSNDIENLRRALVLLGKPEEFRERLRESGILCNKSVTVQGVTTVFSKELSESLFGSNSILIK